MVKKLILILMFLTLLICGCQDNNVYINGEKDNMEGKTFLTKFYSSIRNKNYEEVDAMVGDSLKQLAGTDGISKMVKFINNKVGNYKSYIIDDHYYPIHNR